MALTYPTCHCWISLDTDSKPHQLWENNNKNQTDIHPRILTLGWSGQQIHSYLYPHAAAPAPRG